MTARRFCAALLLAGAPLVCIAATPAAQTTADNTRAQNQNTNTASASVTPAQIQLVESVPVDSPYGTPGVPRTAAVWKAMIQSAQHSIDITAFYVSNKKGESLAPIIQAIAARAKAGVKVRILTGPTFSKETDQSLAPLAKLANVTIRRLPTDRLTGGVVHAKYFIVDDQELFVGSANWDWRAMTQIHELGVRIKDRRMAKTLTAAFDFDWQLAGDGPDVDRAEASRAGAKPAGFDAVTRQSPVPIANDQGQLVGTGFLAFSPPALMPDWVTPEQSALVHLINAAEKTVRVQVMTFSAINEYGAKGYWAPLDTALRNAAARGVKVEIIVANWALREPMQAYLKSLAVLPNITVKYSSIGEAPRGFIPYARVEHCKYAVADDDAVYVGTGNWTQSYFDASVDVSLFANDPPLAATLINIFNRDWNGKLTHVISPGGHYSPPKTH